MSPDWLSEVEDLQALEAMRRYYRWKGDLVRPHAGSRPIEVGCGTGSVLAELRGVERAVGIDRDAPCVAAAQARFAGRSEVSVQVSDVTAPEFLSLASIHPTSVLFVSSLVEIADTPLAVRQAAAVLEPKGRVVVFVSALPWISGTLDRVYGQRRWGKAELKALLVNAGLRIVESRYVNLLGALAWIWDSAIVRRTSTPSGSYGRRDRIVPVARFLDAVTGPPLGRSLFVAAEKPGP